MSEYVDGYVLPVPTDQIEAYRELAAEAAKSWIEHGALQYYECLGDDLEPDMGDVEMATFPDIVGAGHDETVIFAFIVSRTRAHRDEANAAVMEEMETMQGADEIELPFEIVRMAYGGFETLVDYRIESADDEQMGTAG